MTFMSLPEILDDIDRARVTCIGIGDLRAERIDWVNGRYDPHWVIRQNGDPARLAQYSIRDVPDGRKAIQRFVAGPLEVSP
jgi:hypothetical protein